MSFPNPFRFLFAMLRTFWYKARGYEIVADEETVQVRLDTCHACPYNDDGQCVKCGCLILAKVFLNPEECPKHYWLKVLKKRKKS